MSQWRNIDLNLLPSLHALLMTESVTRAAERLCLSQSAVSGQLARLREAFGDKLLIPAENGRGMVTTPFALTLREQLDDLLPRLDVLMRPRSFFSPETSDRHFCVGVIEAEPASSCLASELIKHVRERVHSGMTFSLKSFAPAQAMTLLESGGVDLLISLPGLLPAGLHARTLSSEPLVMVQRRNHPRGSQALTLESYCALEHVLAANTTLATRQLDDRLSPFGLSRKVSVVLEHTGQGLDLLLSTDLVATVPLSIARAFSAIVDAYALPFKAPPIELAMAWHRRTHEDSGSVWLRAQLMDITTHKRQRFEDFGVELMDASTAGSGKSSVFGSAVASDARQYCESSTLSRSSESSAR
ncbi:MAG: LysR family transcriptional regulator [Burkholderiales bacterium]|nr:LysR family transcriptional regulator [Burkholderiales bacterium]